MASLTLFSLIQKGQSAERHTISFAYPPAVFKKFCKTSIVPPKSKRIPTSQKTEALQLKFVCKTSAVNYLKCGGPRNTASPFQSQPAEVVTANLEKLPPPAIEYTTTIYCLAGGVTSCAPPGDLCAKRRPMRSKCGPREPSLPANLAA